MEESLAPLGRSDQLHKTGVQAQGKLDKSGALGRSGFLEQSKFGHSSAEADRRPVEVEHSSVEVVHNSAEVERRSAEAAVGRQSVRTGSWSQIPRRGQSQTHRRKESRIRDHIRRTMKIHNRCRI